ncbi:hypothetical protein VTN31DRAFT_4495 [Thermomyces dupontii]|uniref:uncharacterized protein n=1 Tax=Talaromyces thermophilus TaxID=28565 RepID=UPI0037443C59
MTSNPTPLPPTSILASKPISQSAAHEFLRTFLDRADNDASLQPNALITEKGPVSRTATAAAPNLALHNLKRVQAGLAGEVLGRDLSSLAPPGGNGTVDDSADMWEERRKQERTGWEEEEEGSSVNAGTVAVNGEVDEDQAAGTSASTKKLDKEERKRLKKERRKAEKKARREQTKQAKDAGAGEDEDDDDE